MGNSSQPNLNQDWRFHFHCKRYDIRDITGKSDAELASWLESRWLEKSSTLTLLRAKLDDRKGMGRQHFSQQEGRVKYC